MTIRVVKAMRERIDIEKISVKENRYILKKTVKKTLEPLKKKQVTEKH